MTPPLYLFLVSASLPSLSHPNAANLTLNETIHKAQQHVNAFNPNTLFKTVPKATDVVFYESKPMSYLEMCEQQSGNLLILILEQTARDVNNSIYLLQYLIYMLQYQTVDLTTLIPALSQEADAGINALTRMYDYLTGINVYCAVHSPQASDIKKLINRIVVNNRQLKSQANGFFQPAMYGTNGADLTSVLTGLLNNFEHSLNILIETLSSEYVGPLESSGVDASNVGFSQPAGGAAGKANDFSAFAGLNEKPTKAAKQEIVRTPTVSLKSAVTSVYML